MSEKLRARDPGYKSPWTKRTVALHARVDPETKDEVNAFAVRQKITAAEAIRTLIEWGLESERA